MGDYFQTLVVQDVDLDEAADFAERVRTILVEREIVRPELSKEHVLSGVGHAPGPKWRRAASAAEGATPEGLLTNGVAIEVGRALHGFGATSLVCPSCRAERPMGPEWNAAEAAYVERGEVFMVACSSCRAEAPSTDWRFDWPMALGALAITFWNWPPLKRSFIEELEGEIDRAVKMVRGKF